MMRGIMDSFRLKEDMQSILSGIESGMKEQLVAGVSGSARSLLVSIINQSAQRPVLLITNQLLQAQQLYDDLAEFVGDANLHLYPVNELIASEIAVASPELKSQRIAALTAWSETNKGILIAPVAALKRMLPPKEYWSKNQLMFTDGEEIKIAHYLSSFVEMGYKHAAKVTAPGEFSQCVGIIDIYPLQEKHPIRIELFDDEVDSIRNFDADTQRSLDKRKTAKIGPATELLLTEGDMDSGAERIENALAKTLTSMKTPKEKEELLASMSHDIERLKNHEQFKEMHKYVGVIYVEPASLLDYLLRFVMFIMID